MVRASSKIAFLIMYLMLVCSGCLSQDATAVKLSEDDGSEEDTLYINDDESDSVTDGVDTDEIFASDIDDDGSDSGIGDSDTSPLLRKYLVSCQSDCYTQGANCVGACRANTDSVGEVCENDCLETMKSCVAQCVDSIDLFTPIPSVICPTECSVADSLCEWACSFCQTFDIKISCWRLCIEQKKTCESQCY